MVAVLALPGVVLGDFAIPVELFGRAVARDGRPLYRVVTCGPERMVRSSRCSIRVGARMAALADADTILVAGLDDIERPVPPAVVRSLRIASDRSKRIASICSGAFVLASTGLLDDRQATTHWKLTAELARRFPRIQVQPDVLFVDEEDLLTSAGASAGADLCLHMIRKDFGAEVAAESARLAVVALERPGGQAQFIRHVPPTARGSIGPVQAWIARNLGNQLQLEAIARRHSMSMRTLHRRFLEQCGSSPGRWILKQRIVRAQELLESSRTPIERIAAAIGMPSVSTFRQRFRSVVGTSPSSYRRLYQAAQPARRPRKP